MYILKIRGTDKIPDYIQIRDDSFTLIAYFKISRPGSALARCNLLHRLEEILATADKMEYGIMEKIEL